MYWSVTWILRTIMYRLSVSSAEQHEHSKHRWGPTLPILKNRCTSVFAPITLLHRCILLAPMHRCNGHTSPQWKLPMPVAKGSCGMPLTQPRAATRRVWCFRRWLASASYAPMMHRWCLWADDDDESKLNPESIDSTFLRSQWTVFYTQLVRDIYIICHLIMV